MQFNIFDQLYTEINSFRKDRVHIAGTQTDSETRYLGKKSKGYEYNQFETLNLIELYYNSKYDTGEYDAEGQKKVFLNICKFRAEVAAKQTDIDVKDFVFVPDDNNSDYGAFFLTKKFKRWARENYFGSVINQLNQDFSKYGTCVAKKVNGTIERVPLKNLIVEQSANDLITAKYVIEEHEGMTFDDMEEMKGWEVEDLDIKFGEKHCVYERHGRVPLAWFKEQKGEEPEEGDEKRSIDVLAILLPDLDDKKRRGGSILFLEKEDKRPYEEAHWAKVDGRWLGVGEIENQFDNQRARNMTANLRKRGLYWSSKHLFQSADPDVAKNLIRNVNDGDVLNILPNGNITPIPMESRNLSEFQNFDDVWEKNSDQKSFTYEVATGEALPSGTPFRLGVVLSNSVNSHFALKRENFGIFLGRIVRDQLLPTFKKQNRKEHELMFAQDEKGVDRLKKDIIQMAIWENFRDQLLAGQLPNIEEIKLKVTQEVDKKRNVTVKIPEGYYDYIKATVDVVTTGENVNIEKKIETLTNLYNSWKQSNDPRAEKALTRLLALTGENIEEFQSAEQSVAPQPDMAQAFQQAGTGQLPAPAQAEVNTGV